MATRAGREDASSDNHGVANSNRRGRRAYRHKPARASAVSLFGFLAQIREPRIIRRGGLGLADVDDIAAVGLDLDAGGIDARLARILAYAHERRLARAARLACPPCPRFAAHDVREEVLEERLRRGRPRKLTLLVDAENGFKQRNLRRKASAQLVSR